MHDLQQGCQTNDRKNKNRKFEKLLRRRQQLFTKHVRSGFIDTESYQCQLIQQNLSSEQAMMLHHCSCTVSIGSCRHQSETTSATA